LRFVAFKEQIQFIQSSAWLRSIFVSKRGGKTECIIIDLLKHALERPNYVDNGVDEWTAGLIEPTTEMVSKILVPKFKAFAKPLIIEENKVLNRYILDIGGPRPAVVYLGSGDRPIRWEGGKYNYLGMDECFQQKETLFDECIARISDSNGFLVVAGSLGTNINNPKNTWVYKRLKEKPIEGSFTLEWDTENNPYFPKDQLEKMKNVLDPVTYRQMFKISWDIMVGNRVYDEFTEDNVLESYTYNPLLPTYCSIPYCDGIP